MRLSVTVTRSHLLGPLSDQVADPRPVLDAGAAWLREREVKVFASGNSGQWAADDPITIKIKGGSRVLVDNGGLLDSLTSVSASGAEATYGSDSVTLLTTKMSGLMAQRGARGAPVRNPVPPLTRSETADLTQVLLGALLDVRS